MEYLVLDSKWFSRDFDSVFPPNGPFLVRVLSLLENCGNEEVSELKGTTVWSISLRHVRKGLTFPLFIIEEDVKTSSNRNCNYCRQIGWHNHFLSNQKYHFVVTNSNGWKKPFDEAFMKAESHVLHGLIHGNGDGHLICVNGVQGGSEHLFGIELMDLWDQICTSLHARKIALLDSSEKRTMELRLLHGVAFGNTWFGRWNYMPKEDEYRDAVEKLGSWTLDSIVESSFGTDEVKRIIMFYRDLADTALITLKDLLYFILTLKVKQGITSGTNVYNDLGFLYHHLLLERPTSQIILGARMFIKQWKICTEDFTLRATLLHDRLNLSPEVVVVFPSRPTIGQLKKLVEDEFRRTYCAMAGLKVMTIAGHCDSRNAERLSETFKSGGHVKVNGIGMNLDGPLVLEGGGDA